LVGASTVPVIVVVPVSQVTNVPASPADGPPPQTLGTPLPPQICGDVHEPHDSKLPQPSATGPQFLPSCAHVSGVHAGGAPH
jgi:hypothetical protein